MTRVAVFFAVALLSVTAGVSESAPDLAGTWLPVNIRWQPAPPTVDRDLKSAQAEILYFYKDGRFALVACTLYKRRRGTTVSQGDAQGVYAGTWRADGENIAVQYRLTYRTIEVVGGPPQKQDFEVPLKLFNKQELTFKGKVFRRDHSVDASAEEDIGTFLSPQPPRPEKK